MALTKLVVRGARQHNLKNISVEIPRNTLTVITGLSGSGKSSLAFDTIYAEGQRRYVESLSAYARQFLDQAVPRAAGFATAGPFRVNRTAFLAGKARRRFSHRRHLHAEVLLRPLGREGGTREAGG